MSRYSERKHSRLSKGRLFLCQNCNICNLKENMGSKNFLTYSKPRFQIVWPAFINCFVFCLITLTLMDLNVDSMRTDGCSASKSNTIIIPFCQEFSSLFQ